MKKLATAFAICIGLLATTQAQAHRYHHAYTHHYVHHVKYYRHYDGPIGYGGNVAAARARGLPWCGAYMADKLGYHGAAGRDLWVARNWAGVGHATSPHIGAIVVWRHHVGQIVGQENGEWVINSGNDGHAVRSRARSLVGVIAIRDVGGNYGMAENTYAVRPKRLTHYASARRQYQTSYPMNDNMDRWEVSII